MQKLPIKTVCHVCNTPIELRPLTNMEGITKGQVKCPICESITTCTQGGEQIKTDPIAIDDPVPEITLIDNKVQISINYSPLQARIMKLAHLLHKITFK